MQVSKNKVVVLTYTLTLGTGEVVDEATEDRPFAFIQHSGQTLPAFDQNLEGLSGGDNFSFVLSSEEGYGEYEEAYVKDLDINIFKGENVPDDLLEIGNVIPLVDQHNRPLQGEVVAVNEDSVTLDFNHPLAGEELHFAGKILLVRNATPEELAHGHVHGPGGHEH